MANEQNLIPLNQRSKENAKKIQQMGGQARGAARKRKRSMREAAEYYLSLPVMDKKAISRLNTPLPVFQAQNCLLDVRIE